MGSSENQIEFRGIGVSRQSMITLAMAVLGFAVFLSAVWTARCDAAAVPDLTVHIARFVKVAGCFVVAYMFRDFIPSTLKMAVVGTALMAVHLLMYAGMQLLPAGCGEYEALSVLSGIFTGLSEACITLLFAHILSSYEARISAVAIALGYLLNELFYTTCLYLPAEVVLLMRPLCKAAGIALLVTCLIRKGSVEDARAENPIQYGLPRQHAQERILSFLSSGQEWVLMLISATLLPFIFGLIAHICSSAGMKSGLYDTTNELFALSMLAIAIIYAFLRGERFSFAEVLCYAVPMFATGCLVLPFLYMANSAFSGTLVKCAYTFYQVLFWIFLARKSFEDPRHTYLYFGIYYGLFELATALARLLGSYLNTVFFADPTMIWTVATVSLWLMALYGLFFFLIARGRTEQIASLTTLNTLAVAGQGQDGGSAPDDSPAGALGEGVEAEAPGNVTALRGVAKEAQMASDASVPVVNFNDKLQLFYQQYGISSREQEVLAELIHGYSMDAIGRKLFISRETVKTHLHHVYLKVGVTSKQQLVDFIDHYRG